MLSRNIKTLTNYSQNQSITIVKFDEEDSYLAAGLENGIINLYNLLNQNQPYELGQKSLPVSGIRWRSGSKVTKNKYILISTNVDGNICHWNAQKGELLLQQKQKTQIYGMDLNKENTMYATCGESINVYDEETQSLFTEIKGSENRMYCVKFVLDQQLLSGGLDQCLNLWVSDIDLRTSKKVWSILGVNIKGETLDIQENMILVGQSRMKNSLQLWDIRKQNVVQQIEWDDSILPPGAFIMSCQFSKLSEGPKFILAGSTGANEIGMFEKSDEKYEKVSELKGFEKGVYSVDWCNLSNKFGLGSGDGKILICSMK